MSIEAFDIVIVGAGPAGCSAALHLAECSPELAKRTLVIDAAWHPRPKLCGGGLTLLTQYYVHKLGLDLDVPFQSVNEMVFRFKGQEFRVKKPNALLVIRREEFDAALAGEVKKRGIELREGVALEKLELPGKAGGKVILHTSAGKIEAWAVVGSDGAKSVVRRGIGLEGPSRVSRTIEILTPEDADNCPEFVRQAAVFDFSYVTEGLQGYVWDFPSRVKGEAHMNRGACDFRVFQDTTVAPMKDMFKSYLGKKQIRLEDHHLMGNPSRWYEPGARLSVPGVLLAGDAAGIEPLGGDGISAALGYGEIVAAELVRAAEREDWTFEGYEERLAASEFGKYLAERLNRAKFFYKVRRPLTMRAFWMVLGWQLKRSVSRGGGLF